MNARTTTDLRALTVDELHLVGGGRDEAVAQHEALHKAENSKTPPASVLIRFASMPWRISIRF